MAKKVHELFERVKAALEPHAVIADGVVVVGDADRYYQTGAEVAGLERPVLDGVHRYDAAYDAAVVSVSGQLALAQLQEQPEMEEIPFSGEAGDRQVTGLVQRVREFPNPKGGDPIVKHGHTTVSIIGNKSPAMVDARKSIADLAKQMFGES